MKQGWEIKKLGEIAYIGLGFTHTPEYVESGIPFLSVKDISSGKICWETVKYVSQGEYDSAPKGAKPQKGDIMFCRVGTMGKPIIVTTDKPFCTFVSLGYLHLLNNKTNNTYVKYWMESSAFDIQVKANVKGVAIKNLNTGWLKDFTIPVPPLPEQEKIVSELDCLSGIIEKKRQQLKELDALAQSIFYEMFGNPVDNERGWEVKKLGEVAYIGLGFTHTPEYVEEGVAFLSVKDISSGEICWDKIKYVSQQEYESAPKGAKPKKGDIMFCRVGTMGKPVIVDTDIPFCTFVSLGYLHLLDSNVNNVYVKYWMLSHAFDEQVERNVKGIAVKNLNTGWLKTFEIQVPPLPLQQTFAQKIEAIEQQKALIKQSIAEVETLFNSRMDYYFN